MVRGTKALVALLSALIVLGPFTFSAATQELGCANVSPAGELVRIAAPPFTEGPGTISAFAVHPFAPAMILATNGKQVWMTDDHGCTWKQAFSLSLLPSANQPVSSANSTIKTIEIGEHPRAANTIYLGVEEAVGPVIRPHVVALREGTLEWDLIDQGLPQASGGIWGLHGAPSNPDVVYLHVRRSPASFEDDIYASTDGGSTWARRSAPESATGSIGLVVDPQDSSELWTWGGSGLFHSLDGGRTRQFIDRVAPSIALVDLQHPPGAPARLMAYEPETGSFSVTKDGGVTWSRIGGPPGVAISVAHGPATGDVVMSVHEGLYRFHSPRFWIEIPDARDLPDLRMLTGDRSARPSIFGTSGDAIYAYSLLNEVSLDGFGLNEAPDLLGANRLTPASTKLKIAPGKSESVDFALELAGHPTPLDVFFLVDTSASMQSTIAGLRVGMQRVIDELAASKIDVRFGVGEFKDYPIPGFGDPTSGDFPYRLQRKIGPADDSLANALERLESSGGGTIRPESQLTALYQAVTGEGEPGFVPPGQDAGFRDEALPVIVHLTDAPFSDGAQHPSPPFERVAQELEGRGVRQIGLSIFGRYGPEGTSHLQRMAAATHTLAPTGGVDCDGNGSIDVAAGRPLVCVVTDEQSSGVMALAPAIVATVEAIADEVPVSFHAGTANIPVSLTPGGYPTVDITQRNGLTFEASFRCPVALAGSRHEVPIAARMDEVPIASATVQVVCRPADEVLGEKRRRVPPLAAVPPALTPLAIPIVAPPPPPPPVPQTINAPQSVQALQAAVMPQEQEQLQVAAAFAEFRNQEALALSVRETRPSPIPLYLSAAFMAMVAASFALPRELLARSLRRRR